MQRAIHILALDGGKHRAAAIGEVVDRVCILRDNMSILVEARDGKALDLSWVSKCLDMPLLASARSYWLAQHNSGGATPLVKFSFFFYFFFFVSNTCGEFMCVS